MKEPYIASTIVLILICIWIAFFPRHTSMYELGVKDTHKEAFEMGLMTKEVTPDDKVVYRWIETHKLP